jgi:hypothetical protein
MDALAHLGVRHINRYGVVCVDLQERGDEVLAVAGELVVSPAVSARVRCRIANEYAAANYGGA